MKIKNTGRNIRSDDHEAVITFKTVLALRKV